MALHNDTSLKPGQNNDSFNVSFEVFPPMNELGQKKLTQVARDLEVFNPKFFSVTYGAGGSSQQRTLNTLSEISQKSSHNLAGHLTCVGASKNQSDEIAARYKAMGVNHIVALRGDAPDDQGSYRPQKGGYENAAQLVAGLKKVANFEISVAAYPECHPDSKNRQADLDNLKSKFDAGADRAITQFFFDNEKFYRFRDAARDHGIAKPITPGILLIHDFWKVKKFANMCQTDIPGWLEARFDGLENDPETHQLVAVSTAVEQVLDLASQGVREFHFYTMNRSDLGVAVCRTLGLGSTSKRRSVA